MAGGMPSGGMPTTSDEDRRTVQAKGLAALLDAIDDPDWVTAIRCDIHPNTLSRYRHGRRVMTKKHAEVLAEYLDVSLDDVQG
ncbi:MAG TPA: helix-turn-helix transcriptional regulator [Acidimicrobiales bacterium]|nr:helix-turn-helix transcriptional regulator [Acidimicrobiales bacterium]